MREVRDSIEGPVGLPGANPPKQGRSRLSYERILRASEALLDGRDWEAIAVSEICAAAKVSASSFYSRFETKEAGRRSRAARVPRPRGRARRRR